MYCANNKCPDYVATGMPPEDAAPREQTHHTEVEPVFETADPTEVVVVKGLLESEGIPYVTTGAEKFDAFRGALSPMRFNPSAGIAIFLVPTTLADTVRELLEENENID
jgi:hypothetical protein